MALCDICGLKLKSKRSLSRHFREVHKDIVVIWKCSYCQKPLTRASNLLRHLQFVHKLEHKSAKVELEKCAPVKMPKRKLEDSKPVYMPGMAEFYSDISSDEEMMDDQKLEPMPMTKGGDDGGSARNIEENPARNIEDNVDRFSIDTNILDELVRESGEANEQYLDRILDDVIQDRTDNTETCASNNVLPQSSAPITCETGTDPCAASTVEMGTDARSQETADAATDARSQDTADAATDARDMPTTVVTTITLQFVRTTTLYPDGTTEVMRTHNVTHSDNVQPTAQDLAQIAQDIFTEVPRHMREGNSRYVYRD